MFPPAAAAAPQPGRGGPQERQDGGRAVARGCRGAGRPVGYRGAPSARRCPRPRAGSPAFPQRDPSSRPFPARLGREGGGHVVATCRAAPDSSPLFPFRSPLQRADEGGVISSFPSLQAGSERLFFSPQLHYSSRVLIPADTQVLRAFL